jgi:hypothetical protein
MRYETLGAVIEAQGFEIVNVFGTFASIRDYEPYMAPEHREAFQDLRDYYDVNFLSCIFAPFYPQYSRNCLWELKHPRITDHTDQSYKIFAALSEVAKPWSSSNLWATFSPTNNL